MSGVSRSESFFGFHADFHAHEDELCIGDNVTEQMVEQLIEAVRPDYVQVDCKGHYGYSSYPTKIGYAAPGLKKDLLGIWRKVSKKYQVPLVVHYSGLLDKAAIDHHPEWAAVNADGKPDPFCTSLFGPYVDELLIPQLKELITDYNIDAAWIDGECWGAILDYGKNAVEEFKNKSGINSVPKSKADPCWKEFIEFHRDRFRKYVKHYVDELHKFKHGFQITSNLMYSPWVPEPVSVPLDFLSGDYKGEERVDLTRLASRYLPFVGVPWDIMTWGTTKGKNQYNNSLRPAIQLKQEAASVIAQGGGWQFCTFMSPSGYLDEGTISVAEEVAKFCRPRQLLCHKSQSVPQVAFVLPTKSMYDNLDVMFYFADTARPSIFGPLHSLLELHYSVDVKAEYQLSGHMEDYPVIVIPDCHILPEDFIEELKEYVRKGGHLLLCGPKVSSIFKSELGVSFDGEMIDMDKLYREFEDSIVRKDFAILEAGLPQLYMPYNGVVAACPGLYRKVNPTTAEPINWCYFSRDQFGDKICASTINQYGKGLIGSIHVSLAENYYESHLPVLRKAFGQIMAKIFPDPLVTLDAPNCIDISVKKKDDMLLIHLVNMSGMVVTGNYAAADYILPVVDAELRIRVPRNPDSVEWAYGGKTKSRSYKNGILKIVLDRLDIHDVLVIK